ncbi:FtsW/RodA/SpoVE family cell cycle protein [Paenibacillus sp. FSL H8-0048]|uniref:FtsW/RodA/SpoVE family cell cycle protein n=1 Tax=Paenibacillus sp. FSL H8-0048 TaxID=2954508 RepID=UPI0030FB8A1D
MIEQSKKDLERYLDTVCAEVRAKGMHREIRDELSGHFTDLVTERLELGADEEEAQRYAIAQLGDPQAVGKELHRIHKPRIPWGLLAGVLLLSAVSLLGMAAVEAGFGDYYKIPDALMLRQSVYIVLGIAVMAIMYFINFKHLQRSSGWIYGAALMAIGVSMLLGLEVTNGVRRYVGILGLFFDVVGYSPYVFVVALAGIWNRQGFMKSWSGRTRDLAELSLLLLPAVIYAVIPAFPELIIYMAVSLTLYVRMTRRWIRGSVIAVTFLTGGAIYVWNHLHLRERIIAAFQADQRDTGAGWYLNSVIHNTLTSAGWRGQGMGYRIAEERLLFPYTDLFPVYLIQTFGWAGGLLLLMLTCWFVLKMVFYARAVSDTYGRMLILALALMLSIRLIYGLTILTGRMPLISIPFPFLSYGQHVFIEFAALGLLMGVYRRKDMLPAGQAPSSL